MRALGRARERVRVRAVKMGLVIEWNAHLFDSDVAKFPFHERATYHPTPSPESGGWSCTAPTGVIADDYAMSLAERGIDRAVVVHPEPYGDDHSVVLDVLRRRPDWLGTSLFYPRDDDCVEKLEALVAEQPRIISTRFHAHRGISGFQERVDRDGGFPKGNEYFDSFEEPGVRALWSKAVELGLIVELHIGPNYGKQVAAVLRDIPESIVLIDHFAEPHMGDSVEYADILELASFPNVYMKLSGLGHFADDKPLFESARPFTSRVIEAFGPDRMVWGSGTPVR